MIPQADRWLSPGMLRYIGGLRTYGQRMTFYLGLLNTATLMIVLFHQSPVVNGIFPNVFVWLLFVGGIVVPVAVFADYFLFHVAQITYNQHQNGHENRSPNYRETMENQRRINSLDEKLDRLLAVTDGGQTSVVPECRTCKEAGVADEHKGDNVIVCPGCDRILVRGVVA